MRAYQGTMLADSWTDVRISVLREGRLTIADPRVGEESFRCVLDETSLTLDLFDDTAEHDGQANPEATAAAATAVRGVYALEAHGEVLVACRNERQGGSRPDGVPPGLPRAEEVLAEEVGDDWRDAVPADEGVGRSAFAVRSPSRMQTVAPPSIHDPPSAEGGDDWSDAVPADEAVGRAAAHPSELRRRTMPL